MIDITQSIKACAAFYGKDADAMELYLKEGEKKALDLNNRGPIKFDDNGNLCKEIRKSYSEYGFYIFENVIDPQELNDIKEDLENLRTNFPTGPDSNLDANGDPAFNAGSKPLGDPLGGTELANGRHQIKLFEPEAPADAPSAVPVILLGSLQFSDACLRTYAHPKLLKVAESINGEDFAPFNEALFIKEPGVGAAVSWHQDGVTHWDSEDFNEDIHGFNFMVQVYGSTAVNGVWVLPGTHKAGKIDIKKLVTESGSERLEGAVPVVCDPGDAVMCNRQLLHGSFPNCGYEKRVTVNFGFHKRSSVFGVKGGGVHSESQVFDDEIINRRSKSIGYAIEARKAKYTNEDPYLYKPFNDSQRTYVWDDSARQDLKDYNLDDLSI
jgi:ectoine hydroxylase-related dioxygenase (phytanoyl-CoA dioxygenase family)